MMHSPSRDSAALHPEKSVHCFSRPVHISVELNEHYQTMQGFGVFAGRSVPLYQDPRRNEIMDALFGKDGLQLQVIRSTVFPDFKFPHSTSELTEEQAAEYWIMKTAQRQYKVDKFIASTWSPPYDWKTRKGQNTGKDFNALSPQNFEKFANYMADFVEWYQGRGIQFYAISPQNEPEYAAPLWDGCVWFPNQTGRFVRNSLKPTFATRGLTTKIMIGETANWNLASIYLGLTFLFLGDGDVDIAASHGYSVPQFPGFRTVTYSTNILPWFIRTRNIERWITEVSATDPYDPSIRKGIEFGVSLHQFLTVGNVEGFVFWLGMVSGPSNEALIMSKGNVTLHKAYDVYGHFTRFVKAGWIRVKASKRRFSFAPHIHVSAFKSQEAGRFAIIVINSSSTSRSDCVVSLKDTKVKMDSVRYYLSGEEYRWHPMPYVLEDNVESINVLVTPMSIVTVTGSFVI